MPNYVWAIFNFPGTTEEDLPLVIGDRIEVLMTDDEFNDGWWEGRNDAGRTGLFPKIYTAETLPPPSTAASSVHETMSRAESEASFANGRDSGVTRALSPTNATATHLANSLASSRAPPGHLESSSAVYGESRSPPQPTSAATAALRAASPPVRTQEPRPAPPVAAALPTEVEKWTPQQVSQHFREQGVGDDTASKFLQHEVTGDILLAMHHEDLKEIDIMAFGKRFEIMREIDNLKQRTEASVLSPIEPLQPVGNGNGPVGLGIAHGSAPNTQRRTSRVLPTHSATGAVLQDGSSSSSMGDYSGMSNALPEQPVENSALVSVAEEARTTNEQMRNNSIGTGSETLQVVNPIAARNVSPQRSHRKSMSTSSAALLGAEPVSGKRSPEKGHGRSWSQDTVKMPSAHKKSHSGNLSSVREGRGGSIGGSTDSDPRSPPSTLGSPISTGVPISPSTGLPKQGGFSGAKRMLMGSRKQKWQPNAVSQNLETVAAGDASKDGDYSGFMRKRSDRAYSWKLKYFVLRGTRLAIYDTDKDNQERGLIDINSYRVVAVDDILFYSPNKFTFKLVPPAPGATRSLNFTPPKTHYFCTESRDQLRDWMAAFTKATIGRDWSTPVISSCTTKTISLKEAQEQRLLQQQRQQADSSGSRIATGSPTFDGLGGQTAGIGGTAYADLGSPDSYGGAFEDRSTLTKGGRQLDPAIDLSDGLIETPVALAPTSVPSGRRPLVSPVEDPEANPLTSPSQAPRTPYTNGFGATPTSTAALKTNGSTRTSNEVYRQVAAAGGASQQTTSSSTPIAEQFRKVPSDSSLRRAVMTVAGRDRP